MPPSHRHRPRRLAATLGPPLLLHVAAGAWCAAFVVFALVYGPALLRPRKR